MFATTTIPRKKRIRISASKWKQHVVKCQKRGLSPEEYCQEQNLPLHRFRFWARKNREVSRQPFVPAIVPGFPESSFQDSVQIQERHCTLDLGNGKKLAIESREALGEVIRILRKAI